MNDTTLIAALPVGELADDSVKRDFEKLISVFRLPETELVVADPVTVEATARESVHALSAKNPDLLLIIPLRGLSAQTIEAAVSASTCICLICPVEGRFALPSSVLAIGAVHEANIPVELLYALPDDPGFIERARSITRAAKAFSRIRKSRIGIIGGLFPNLVSSRYEAQTVTARLGISLLPITFETLHSSMHATAGNREITEASSQEISRAYNVSAADKSALEAGNILHIALKQMAIDQKIDGFATECWSAFPKEVGLNPCMGFIDDSYSLACEGDVLLCASLWIVRYLTGTRPYAGDLYDLDINGILTLVHCGAPASLAADKNAVVLSKSQLALERGFETMTVRPKINPGPVTLLRLYGTQCDQVHVASGELLGSEQSPDSSIKVKLKGDRWEFLDQCFGNHYVAASGDIRKELRLLCKWLGITIHET